MTKLQSDYLGLRLRSPLVASSSPLTGDLDGLRRLEDAGAGAVVLPSLFEEEVEHDASEIDRMLEAGADRFGEALSYFPEYNGYESGPDQHLELVSRAREALEIPVIASLNGVSQGGWLEYAKLMEEAGAHALELNLYRVAASPDTTAAEIEEQDRQLVEAASHSVGIPLAVKLSPFFTALAHTARELVGAGASGLVLFNRFYQPDLDIETRQVEAHLTLSRSEELRLPLRWIAILHRRIEASLAATTGIHVAEDAIKALLAGADVAMLASALLERGPGHLREVESGIVRWMDENEYASVEQLRGSASQSAVPDPSAYERGNYMKTLRNYSSPSD
jgi:dihydroorotate dehydrogenase (fumarate)